MPKTQPVLGNLNSNHHWLIHRHVLQFSFRRSFVFPMMPRDASLSDSYKAFRHVETLIQWQACKVQVFTLDEYTFYMTKGLIVEVLLFLHFRSLNF